MTFDPSDENDTEKLQIRTHTPRPDELTRESFEFIAAIDQYKRRHMRSFLDDAEVLHVLASLGYARTDQAGQAPSLEAQVAAYGAAKSRYRTEEGRLFPTWSEVFELLLGLGYQRADREHAA